MKGSRQVHQYNSPIFGSICYQFHHIFVSALKLLFNSLAVRSSSFECLCELPKFVNVHYTLIKIFFSNNAIFLIVLIQ